MLTETMCIDAHMYGAFNIAYGVGSACEFSAFDATCSSDCHSVGPVAGGQVSS
jgi:hypothetical protein